MEPTFLLPIFPAGSLAGSVTTTVWVGVMVTCYFNLRFGWVLSGLVVPGYVVPLLLLKPWAAAVILFEGIVTYLIVWAYSEYLPRYGPWNGLFGRDRFFAILLVSILVRIVCETFMFPPIGEYINSMYGLNFDYRNNFHSFGLLVVALLANQFWKPGLVRGLLPVLVTNLVTLLVVRYVLMEFTNFNLGTLDFLYEDVAASMLASPKTYIILLTTALFASRMNLNYGWEFSGILIPSLLALQWYQPYKLLFTFLETFIILVLGALVLRVPSVAARNIEGARKVLVFFTISFLYHLVLGHVVLEWFPQQKVTDLYGFGYLLTTLMAIHMYNKDASARVTRAVLQTSLVTVILASLIGFGLTYVPNLFAIRAAGLPVPAAKNLSHSTIMEEVRRQKIDLYRHRMPRGVIAPLPEEMEIFETAMNSLMVYVHDKDAPQLEKARKLLWTVNYEVTPLEAHHLYLREREPTRGWGSYVVNLEPATELLVEVPSPLDEWGSMEAGASLYTSVNGRALAISGSTRRTLAREIPDVLDTTATMFRLFQKAFGSRGILQVRGYTTQMVRSATGRRPEPHEVGPPEAESVLWLTSSVPEDLNLVQLKEFVGPFRIEWGHAPWRNVLRDMGRSHFAELVLNRTDARTLMFKPLLAGSELKSYARTQSITGYLGDWLLSVKDKLPARGTDLYVPPQLPELLYLDQEVLTPLLQMARKFYKGHGWTPEGLEELRAISTHASALGYEVIRYRHTGTGHDYLILQERDDAPKKRFWGTYVFRVSPSKGYVIQIPRPISELNVFEYGVMLFDRLQAAAILIGATHPMANIDGSADVIQIENRQNFFNLVSQVILRESPAEPMLVVQCRAFGFRPDAPAPTADAIISFRSGVTRRESLDRLSTNLIRVLDRDKLNTKFADGSLSVAGYEVGGIPQSMYVDFSGEKEFAVIWLSPVLRPHFRQETEDIVQEQQFRALGIETVQIDLFDFLEHRKPVVSEGEGLSDLQQTLTKYMESRDIVILAMLQKQRPNYTFRRLIDISSKQSYLVVTNRAHEIVLTANLFPLNSQTVVNVRPGGLNRTLVRRYVDSRSAWLRFQ